MNFGIALAGGGTRGAAHVGVLIALEEENLIPTAVAGASAGSIAAGFYAMGMSGQEMAEIITYLAKKGGSLIDIDFGGILKFIPEMLCHQKVSLSGLIKGDKLQNYLCSKTHGISIADVPIKIVIPAVDINSGKTIAYTNAKNPKTLENVNWEKNILLCQAMTASSAVPAVFCPRFIDNYCLVDGGVTNVMPVDLLIGAGESTVIAVDVSEDYEMPDKDTIIEIASHSFSIMSRALKDCTSTGEILLLKPKLPKKAGLLTFDQMVLCMNEGYLYTKEKMPAIKQALYNTKDTKHNLRIAL